MKIGIPNIVSASRKALSPDMLAACREIEASLQCEQAILYGLDFFHDCLRCMYEDNEELLRACHDELLAGVRYGAESLRQSELFLAEALQGNVPLSRASSFRIDVLQGCPGGPELRSAAEALLEAHKALFPERPYDSPLTTPEVLRLLDAAALGNRSG